MKEILFKIEQLASLLFDDAQYDTFMCYLKVKSINSARLFLENNIDYSEQQNNSIYNELEDILMDLIVMEIDDGEERKEFKQLSKSTG